MRPREARVLPRATPSRRGAHLPRLMHARRLRLLVLVAALCVLAVPPPTALAIITPDAPTPPKPTPSTTTTTTPAGEPRPPATTSSGSPTSSSAPAAREAEKTASTDSSKGTVPKDEHGDGTTGRSEPLPTTTAPSGSEKPPQPMVGRDAVATEKPVNKPASANEKDTASPPKAAAKVEVVHERYVRGRGASGGEYFDDDDLDDRDIFATSSFEIEDSDADAGGAPGSGKRQNYASLDAGATILDSSPELKSPTNLLVPDKDRYMLMPCEKPRKWVVVSLSEDVHADAIAVANFEKFSSTVKEFIVLGSVNYPTDTWFVLGNFTAAQQNGEQIFPLDSQHHVRYIKLRFFSHYGSEYYCTLSQLKVYGRTFTQVISQLEKSIDADGALEMTALPPPTTTKNDKHHGGDGVDFSSSDRGINSEDAAFQVVSQTCSAGDAVLNVFWVNASSNATCSILDAPKQSPAKPPPFLPQPSRNEYPAESELTNRELAALEVLGRHVDHHPVSNANATTNASTASPRSNASTSAVTPSTATTNALHAQGLGRLESIFVRITKKIQQLELNQSIFARQIEETQAQQKALTTGLHAKQDALAAQMQDIRTILSDMRTRMERENLSNEEYRHLVDELRKENVALWNEMLVVREVITTMKAAILCALGLSACIIAFYLLRLLLRCLQSAKRRADLREWFWRMESLLQQQNDDSEANASEAVDNNPVGSWRVNYKKQFGSSWDDLAIERKTLLRDLVDEEALSLQTVHGGHRNKRMRTASLVNPPKLQDLMVQMELAHLAAEAGSHADSKTVVKQESESNGCGVVDSAPHEGLLCKPQVSKGVKKTLADMERGLVRRPSTTESTASSGCDVTFDDVDDSQVFAYLDEGDDYGSSKPAEPRTVEFRLDFSSRAGPLPVSPASPPMSRRSSTNSVMPGAKSSSSVTATGRILQRSPSMRANTVPFRKRLSRRPSEPAPDATISAAVAKASSLRAESPPGSPTSSSPSLHSSPLPSSVGPIVTPPTRLSASPTASKSPVLGGDDAMIFTHNGATTTVASEINKLQTENDALREELTAYQSNVVELQERVRLAEQQNESLSDQIMAVQEAYESKLRSAYDAAAIEREELYTQKEAEMEELRKRSEEERELLAAEMKMTIAKIESELQSDADQLQRLLRDGKEQTNALKNQIVSLQVELKSSHAEKQQLSQSDASWAAQCESLQRSADHWEEKCRCLQDQVHQLLYEQDNSRRREATERQENERKQALQRAIQERFALQVQQLQSQLKALATGAHELIKAEVKKTAQLLARLQQQASEVAIQHNEKAMELVAKQNRIIQLETQLKNERQSVMQLDSSLAKATRAMQKKEELFRTKHQEQKEFLDITVAVRNGLTNELQNKKKRLDELELQLRETTLAREAAEKKSRHLQQQVKIMQHMHAREMELVALARQEQQTATKRRGSVDSSSGGNSRRPSLKSGATGSGGLGTSRSVAASYKFSSLKREPVLLSASGIALTEAGESLPADHARGQSDQTEEHPKRWLPEDDVFAAEEWREFVEIAALHEAECRYHFHHRHH